MPRTPKSPKRSVYKSGRRRAKKTAEQKQAEQAGRLRRSAIENLVRKENAERRPGEQMNEKQIGIEVRRRIAESKKPKSTTYGIRYW